MKKISYIFARITLLLPSLLAIGACLAIAIAYVPQPVVAQFNPVGNICSGSGGATAADPNCTKGNTPVTNILKTAVNFLLFMAGAAATIFIIYGAYQYASSGGDAATINKAKTTILYAVIGLVVSVSAFAIATFVETVISHAK